MPLPADMGQWLLTTVKRVRLLPGAPNISFQINTIMSEMRNLITLLESIDAGEPYKKNGITIIDIEDFVDVDVEEQIEEAPGDMLGISSTDLEGQELEDYLDRIKNKEKTKKDKFTKPYIHGGNIEIVDDKSGKKYDTDKLMAAVKERPKAILKQNQKMQHSDGSTSVFYRKSVV